MPNRERGPPFSGPKLGVAAPPGDERCDYSKAVKRWVRCDEDHSGRHGTRMVAAPSPSGGWKRKAPQILMRSFLVGLGTTCNQPCAKRGACCFVPSPWQARQSANATVFSGKSEIIDEGCHEAAAAGLRYLSEGHSLQLHSSQINRFRAGYTLVVLSSKIVHLRSR